MAPRSRASRAVASLIAWERFRDISAGDAAQARVIRALLRPVDCSKLRIDGDSDAPPGLATPVLVAAPRLGERFDLRAVEVRAHHTHALAVAPIKLARVLLEMDLLRCVGAAWRDDGLAIAAVEIDALDRTVVKARNAHIGPIDMTRLGIHDDAIGEPAFGNDDLVIGTVGIHRVNAAPAQFKKKEAATACRIR
jgi:hypothetical protein